MNARGTLGRWFALSMTAAVFAVAILSGVMLFLQRDRLLSRLLESEGTIAHDRLIALRARGESLRDSAAAIGGRLGAAGLVFAVYDSSGALVAGDPSVGRGAPPADLVRGVVGFHHSYEFEVPGGRAIIATDPVSILTTRLWVFGPALLAAALALLAWFVAPKLVSRALDPFERALLDQRSADRERMRRLLADASHELRTPLAVMRGYFSVIERGAIFDGPLVERILRVMESEVDRLQRLVDGLLRLARVENGLAAGPALGRARCADVVSGAVGRVGAADEARLRVTCDADLPEVVADTSELVEALGNVVDNALKYAPASSIEIRARRRAAGVEIVVRDEGPGMSADDRAHVFERFYRGELPDGTPGSGLGLPIARGIVERAGGSIELESRPGEGTTVRIALLAAKDGQAGK